MEEFENKNLSDDRDEFASIFARVTLLIQDDALDEAAYILSNLHHADLADFLDNSNQKIHRKILPLLSDIINPNTLIWLSDYSTKSLVSIIGEKKIADLIGHIDIEDAIDVIERLAEDSKNLILSNLAIDKRQQIIEGFYYPENTAGRVVEKHFIFFHENWNVGQAIDSIRRKNLNKEFYAAIIVDEKFCPVGTILLSSLLTKKRTDKILDFMDQELKLADSFTQLSEIAFIFKQYALTIVPVVNKNGKLIGTLSINNMIYIIEEQAEKNLMQLGGVYGQYQYIFSNFITIIKGRLPWLLINLSTAWITSSIITQFTDIIGKIVALAAIMPIVASTGGNAGTQVMAITILALANKDINKTNKIRVVARETMLCIVNGLVLALIGGALVMIFVDDIGISMVFSCAILINFSVAGFFGSSIPITLYNLGIDPAISSGILVTALTDSLGFFSFLGLAYMLLT